MDRRTFTFGALSAVVFGSSQVKAGQYCSSGTPFSPAICTAEIDLGRGVYAYRQQYQSQWCWAAAAEMIFAFHGYRLSQQRIVTELYGGPLNLRSGPTTNISGILNRDWTDENGRRFRCRLSGLYDAFLGISGLNNAQIISALRTDQPLFYCNRDHAMVQTSISYIPTQWGPNVRSVGFFDPWPGVGRRGASVREMIPAENGGDMTYVGLPRIRRL